MSANVDPSNVSISQASEEQTPLTRLLTDVRNGDGHHSCAAVMNIRHYAGDDPKGQLELLLSLMKALVEAPPKALFDYMYAAFLLESLVESCYADDREAAVDAYLQFAEYSTADLEISSLTRYFLVSAFARTEMVHPLFSQTMERIDSIDRKIGCCKTEGGAAARYRALVQEYGMPAEDRLAQARALVDREKKSDKQRNDDLKETRKVLAPLLYTDLPPAQQSEMTAIQESLCRLSLGASAEALRW